MQTLTERVLRLAPPGGLFDETVVRNLFPSASEGARRLLVHRATSAKEVLRLKPGLFVLAPEFRANQAHPFTVASALHSPSYVSLESALAHHGLIPEAIFQVASVTQARSREFHTPLGVFTFHRVPSRPPMVGTQAVQVEGDAWAFVATPMRALADIVYLRKGVTWEHGGSAYLTESLRVDLADLRELEPASLDEVTASTRDRRTREYLQRLREELWPA